MIMIDLAVFYLNGIMKVFVLEQKCAEDKVWFALKNDLLFLFKKKTKTCNPKNPTNVYVKM